MKAVENYRISIRLEGPLGTRMISGTLFGHLCWSLRHLESESALGKFLEEVEGAPFLLSDALPAGWLPAPLLAPRTEKKAPGTLAEAEEAKKNRKREWMRVEEYLAARGGMTQAAAEKAKGKPPEAEEQRLAHNRIDRLTGTTPERGGLYFTDETWAQDTARDLEVHVRCGMEGERLLRLFRFVGEHGYGRDATLGRGRFTCRLEGARKELFAHEGDRWMSLSHGALSENMRAPLYKASTHYGKLGSLYANVEVPFKYPVTLLRPGATFAGEGPGPYGALLRDVHPFRKEVVHNAWHLAVPFSTGREAER